MANASIDVDLQRAYRKIDQPARDRGRIAMANQMWADMNRYVPYLGGALRRASYVTPKGHYVVYREKYATKQFYVQAKRYSTPGTGSRWDLKASAIHMENWKQTHLRGAGIK